MSKTTPTPTTTAPTTCVVAPTVAGQIASDKSLLDAVAVGGASFVVASSGGTGSTSTNHTYVVAALASDDLTVINVTDVSQPTVVGAVSISAESLGGVADVDGTAGYATKETTGNEYYAVLVAKNALAVYDVCLLYTSPSPRDRG